MNRFQTLVSIATCAPPSWPATSASTPARGTTKFRRQGLADNDRHGVQRTLKKPSILDLNSLSGLVSKIWYRIPVDQSEPSKANIPPTKYPVDRPGRDPWLNRPSISRRSEGLVPPTLSVSDVESNMRQALSGGGLAVHHRGVFQHQLGEAVQVDPALTPG